MKTLLLAPIAGLLMIVSGAHAQTTSINIFNNSSTTLKNAGGTLLTAGPAGNNNGALVQLGYYSTSSANNNFSGIWVPLTSFGNSTKTTVGDSGDGSNLGDGLISFNLYYALNSSSVGVYNSALGDTATYTTSAQNVITSSLPAQSQVLSLRIYDTNAGTGAYNAVSSNSWLWQVPSSTPATVNINLGSTSTVMTWQDASNPFRTTIPVPEPSGFGMVLLGIGSFILSRRYHRVKAA